MFFFLTEMKWNEKNEKIEEAMWGNEQIKCISFG